MQELRDEWRNCGDIDLFSESLRFVCYRNEHAEIQHLCAHVPIRFATFTHLRTVMSLLPTSSLPDFMTYV